MAHHEVAPCRLHVGPAQVGALLRAQADVCAQQDERPVAGVARPLGKGGDLVVGVGTALVPGRGLVAGRAAVGERVEGDGATSAQRGVETPTGGQARLDGGGGEATAL